MVFQNMEENAMKKISLQRAMDLLTLGIFPKCEVSRDVRHPIRSMSELESYQRLSEVQGFTLFGYDDETLRNFQIPENSLSVNIDEASDMLVSGSHIYGRRIEEDEVVFSSIRELLEFYKSCQNSGDSFLLYWRDE